VKCGCYKQTITTTAIEPYSQSYDKRIVNSTGKSLASLCDVIDKGQPVIIYHTVLCQKPFSKTFKIENTHHQLVTNIHFTVLIGYDDNHYYYIDPLWSNLWQSIIISAIFPIKYQIIKINKYKLKSIYNYTGRISINLQK